MGQDEDWLDWLDGDLAQGAGATAAAQQLAAENDATLQGGAVPTEVNGYPGYEVAVRTNYTVGESVIPGTEGMHANAHATAVIQPRCDIGPDVGPEKAVELDCDGEIVDIDPENFELDDLPDASVLFSVHLAE